MQSLEQVIDDLTSTFGTWRVAWGDLNRLERRQSGGEEPFRDDVKSLPVAGAPGDLGIVFNFYARPEKDQKRRYGENSDPASPHYFDQAELYSKQEFKPAYFTMTDIKAHAERVYHPGAKE